jgi:hypothetical protein
MKKVDLQSLLPLAQEVTPLIALITEASIGNKYEN